MLKEIILYLYFNNRQIHSQKRGEIIMPRKGENIYKRKDGRWEGRIIIGHNASGKAKYKYLYAHSYREVKAKMKIENNNITTSGFEGQNPISFKTATFQWLNTVKVNCKISSYNKYRNIAERVIIPQLGKYYLHEINNEILSSFATYLLTVGKQNHQPYSRKSANDICIILKQILKYASLTYDIALNVEISTIKIKQNNRNIQVFSKEEQSKLCSFLPDNTNYIKLGILTSLYTGIRRGELCALKWNDISFTKNTMMINKTAQRIQQLDSSNRKTKVIITSPKSSCSIREIPMPISLSEILKKYVSSSDSYLLSGNQKCTEPRIMQYYFKKYLKLCNLPNYNFHTLRHTFATRCIELGFDVKTLSEILGHSSVNITLNNYVHSSFKRKQESMNKLSIENL